MNDFKIKRKKDTDWQFIIRVLYCFFFCVAGLLTIVIWVGAQKFTFIHFFIFLLCAIPLSILCAFIVERAGTILSGMFLGWAPKKISLREQFTADLEKARYSKMNNRFEESLETVNDVLNKDGDFPDALFLKAQIMWEGFGKSVEAKNLFRRVMQQVSAEKPLYRWSLNYIEEITLKDKERVDEFKWNQDNME
jgi:hypothetical protein